MPPQNPSRRYEEEVTAVEPRIPIEAHWTVTEHLGKMTPLKFKSTAPPDPKVALRASVMEIEDGT